MTAESTLRPRIGLLFNYDWDALGYARQAGQFRFDTAGFDLFSFPSNARLVGFDLRRFATALECRRHTTSIPLNVERSPSKKSRAGDTHWP